jgi:hypothetical protein
MRVAQVAEHLPTRHKALSRNTSITKKKKEEEERRRERGRGKEKNLIKQNQPCFSEELF